MRLLFFDTKPCNPNSYISRAVFLAIRRDLRVKEAVWVSYANAIDVALKSRFNAFVAFDGEEAANPIVQRLCELIPKRIIWFTEDPYEYYRNIEVAKNFSLVFTNDANTAKRYPNLANHLPLAADKDSNFIPMRSNAFSYDIFFAGSAWPNRLEFLKHVKDGCGDLRMKLILVSNGAIAPLIQKYASEFEFSEGVSIRDFCRIANRSLLTLALPRSFSTNPQNPQLTSDTPGPRLFETALAGSCQLIDSSLTPLATTLFNPSKHLLTYRFIDDCLETISRAVKDPGHILRIAQSAQQHALKHHLYDHRAEKLVTALDELPTKSRMMSLKSIKSSSPKIIFVAHNIIKFGVFGGAEIYLDQIRLHAKNCNLWILVPDRNLPTRVKYTLFNADMSVADEFSLERSVELGDLTHPEFEIQFQRLLSEYGFDIVHINHLMGYPHSLPHFARAYGAKVVFSLHDYHSICENYNLIGIEGQYCEITERPLQTCDICYLRTRGFPPGSQSRRLRFMRESFEKVDSVLVGSQASADIFLKLFPHMRNKIIELVPPLLANPAASNFERRRRQHGRTENLHVAWLGNFTRSKGADTALEVFKATRNQPVTFHIFGRLDDIDDYFKSALAEAAFPAVVVHGQFNPGSLPKDLQLCDIALFLSPWPETYCMTLSEAQAVGLIPIVTKIGAQAERVDDGINGLHVPVNDATAVISALRSFLHHPDLISEMRARQPVPSGMMPEQFVSRLEDIYTELLKNRARLPVALLNRPVSLDELGIYLLSPRWLIYAPRPQLPNAPRPQLPSAHRSRLPNSNRIMNFLRYPRRTFLNLIKGP